MRNAWLTFAHFAEINRRRAERWHNRAGYTPWTGSDWSNAMCGEAGEVANVVKKIRRLETREDGGSAAEWMDLLTQLQDEIGDVIAYLSLLADHYSIDLAEAARQKFNAVSQREGLPERIERSVGAELPG